MKFPFAVLFATLYGLIIRLLFGVLGSVWEIMSVSFLILSPAVIGFLTVILLPKSKNISFRNAFFMPWITTLVLLVITIAFNIEGTICWIMIYPLFSVVSGFGGIGAYYVRDSMARKSNRTKGLNISFLVLLPLCAGFIERDAASATKEYQVSSEVVIKAPSAMVWHQLTHINNILPNEHKGGVTQLFGFPRHIKTVIDTLATGGHRKAYFEKGLFFDETIVGFIPEKMLKLAIKSDPSKIPPTVLDEHIVIGGKHINVFEDTYQLEKLTGNSCKLKLSTRFSICTPFNWYAIFWADMMMHDILKDELNLIKSRTGAAGTGISAYVSNQ